MSTEDNYGHGPELDPSKRAASELDKTLETGAEHDEIEVLDERLRERREKRKQEEAAAAGAVQPETVKVSEARMSGHVLEAASARNEIRLLIFSRDPELLKEGSARDTKLREIAGLFGEVHIVLLLPGAARSKKAVRRGHNIWVYEVHSNWWWMNIFKARAMAKEQLTFANGFRADIVIAEDPFECGAAATHIAEAFDRPFQLHVREDFFDPQFRERDSSNKWRMMLVRHAMREASCVRTESEYLKDRIVEKYRDLKDYTEVLPVYYNLTFWRDATPAFDLRTRYPQFKFIVLHVSEMNVEAHTDWAISGIARILKRYPTIGMVVVGDGPERSTLEKHAIKLGVQNQVLFEPKTSDLTSHLKSAHALLHTSDASAQERVLLHAAAVELPIVSCVQGLAGELFIDGDSALLCPIDSPPCYGEKLNTLLNENQLRKKIGMNAQNVVFSRVEQDYGSYLQAYKASIERCLITTE